MRCLSARISETPTGLEFLFADRCAVTQQHEERVPLQHAALLLTQGAVLLPGAAPGRYTKVFLPLSFGADFDPSELVSGGVTAQLATVRFFFQVFYERVFC